MANAYAQFADRWGPNARLAWETIAGRQTRGIPSWLLHPMDHGILEEFSGHPSGSYRRDPVAVYLDFQRAIGTCLLDQWIPENPLTMGERGFEAGSQRRATTGAERVMLDGIAIDSPEAVIAHLEKVVFPDLQRQAALNDAELDARVRRRRAFGRRAARRLNNPRGFVRLDHREHVGAGVALER